MTSNGTGDPDALREEIRRTRAELGETVEALAAKADVKARLKDSADQAKERLREQAAQARERMRGQAAQTGDRMREQAGSLRSSAYDLRENARREPLPWGLLAAGALTAVIVVLVVRGRRK